MAPAPHKRRWFRPQISLRTLLLLMLLAGVGLTVYRWPWVETFQRASIDQLRDNPHQLFADLPDRYLQRAFPYALLPPSTEDDPQPPFIEKVTFRRNWRGKKIKHGLSQTFANGQLWSERHFYDGELNGSEREFNKKGQVTRELHFREGQVHGAIRIGDGTAWALQGHYDRGKRHGMWQYLVPAGIDPEGNKHLYQLNPLHVLDRSFPVPEQAQLVRGQWIHDQLHGKWTWETDGKVVHTEEFDHDDLVRLNGKPIVEEFWQWVRVQNDPHLLAELTVANTTNWDYREQSFGSILHRVCFETEQAHVFLYPSQLLINWQPEQRGRLIPALCEFAARNDLAFTYRYGMLWLVHAQDRDKPFVDSTGVDKIAFAKGSKKESSWNQAVPIHSCEHSTSQGIASVLDKSEIEYEISNLDLQSIKFLSQNPHDQLFIRRRRDALGFVLYLTGCRCELRGEVLVIQPQEGRAPEQANAWPLMPVQGFRY